jgi:DNA-binding Xre family transcriptional regulator
MDTSRRLAVRRDKVHEVNQAVKRKGKPNQEKLAQAIEISRSTLSLFRNGKSVSIDSFQTICKGLDLNWEEIADFDHDSDKDMGDINSSDQTVPEYPEGSVPPNSPFYIERLPIEQQCYHQVLQPSSLIRIRAPKLMGKTSLMSRILFSAAKRGYKTVHLDFDGADLTALANQCELLSWFWNSIARELKLEKQVADWDDMVSLNLSCSNYFEDYLLSKIDTPFVLGLDQVDKLFFYKQTAPNFFGLLRAWHEKRKNYPLWQKLRLVVTYATDAYIPHNEKLSPFNVGMEVGLPDFTDEQVLELARKHKLSWNREQISELGAMVGGHPHLVRVAMYNSSQKDLSLREILQDCSTQAGIYSKHLNYCWTMLKKDQSLFEAFKKVVKSPKAIVLNPEEARDLESIGLIKKEGNRVHPRYKLYREFFLEFL